MKNTKLLTASLLMLFSCLGSTLAQDCPVILSETVFKKGDNGFDTYRIPSVVQAKSGAILVFAEARKNSSSDTGNIDLVLRRSLDGGRTWGEMITVWDDGANSCSNPTPVVDQKTGRIILLSSWNNGKDLESEIDERTSIEGRRVYVFYSDDEGLTWSSPREITSSVKEDDWTWYATGPCHAIQLKKGRHAGRIVVPCNHNTYRDGRDTGSSSHVIYSDDGGETWYLGATAGKDGNESTIAELKNGNLLINMRSGVTKNREVNGFSRLLAVSEDQGATFNDNYHERALVEPVCNGSMVNYTPKGKLTKTLLFSNPNHETKRRDMTVRMSKDNGTTWSVACRISENPAAYSDMVVLNDGNVGMFYETGAETCYERMDFIVLPAELFE